MFGFLGLESWCWIPAVGSWVWNEFGFMGWESWVGFRRNFGCSRTSVELLSFDLRFGIPDLGWLVRVCRLGFQVGTPGFGFPVSRNFH